MVGAVLGAAVICLGVPATDPVRVQRLPDPAPAPVHISERTVPLAPVELGIAAVRDELLDRNTTCPYVSDVSIACEGPVCAVSTRQPSADSGIERTMTILREPSRYLVSARSLVLARMGLCWGEAEFVGIWSGFTAEPFPGHRYQCMAIAKPYNHVLELMGDAEDLCRRTHRAAWPDAPDL